MAGQKRGEEHGKAKLTASEIPILLRMLDQGVGQRVIAEKFGISISQVCMIGRGHYWKVEWRKYYENECD